MGDLEYTRLHPLLVDVRQATPYTCGVSCVQAILNYYGIHKREDELAKQLHATRDQGTSTVQIVRVFRQYGLRAIVQRNNSLKKLKANLMHNIPTMVAIQAWPDNPVKNWQSDWEDGHWVVVIAMNNQNIIFEDPSLLGVRGLLDRDEFLSRWHDYEGPPPYQKGKNETLVHLSIAVVRDVIQSNASFYKSLKLYGKDVAVFKNPSSADVREMRQDMPNLLERDRAVAPLRFGADARTKELYVWDANLATHVDVLTHIYSYTHITNNPSYATGFADIKGNRLVGTWLNVWDRRDFKKEDWAWLEDYMDMSNYRIGRWTGD